TRASGSVGPAGVVVGMLAIADDGPSSTAFLAPFFVIGLGAGCTFTPMATEVMRNVPLRLSGAASGVNNAVRQVGSVLAAAVIGAVLQARLASALRDQAVERAGAIPAGPYRDSFVNGFSQAGKHGLDVGTGATQQLPAGMPHDLAQRVQDTAAQVFGHGFIDTMTAAMGLTAATLLLGAAACLAVKRHHGQSVNPHGLPLSEAELADADRPVPGLQPAGGSAPGEPGPDHPPGRDPGARPREGPRRPPPAGWAA